MFKFKKIVACSFALISASTAMTSSSYAFDLSALGGVTLSNLSQATPLATSLSSGTSYGFGALLGHDLMPMFALEGGLFYMQHSVGLNGALGTSTNVSMAFNNLSLPVMLRFSPLPFLAVEAGGYLGLSSNASISGTSTTANSDHGLIGGVTVMMPLAPTLRARLSGFYEYGLSNLINSTTTSISSRNIDILGGVIFDL